LKSWVVTSVAMILAIFAPPATDGSMSLA